MAGSKRTHEAIFIEDVPASRRCEADVFEKEEALANGIDERSTKKLKAGMQDHMYAPRSLSSSAPSVPSLKKKIMNKKKVPATRHITAVQDGPASSSSEPMDEDNLEPASFSDDRAVALSLALTAVAQPLASNVAVQPPISTASAITLSVTSASNIANNPHAPVGPQALAAYLNEVGTRNLALTRTPLQTPPSKATTLVRELIFNRAFQGWSNKQCRDVYTARGGIAGSDQAVSKHYMNWAPKWFEEENTVLPWVVRGHLDRQRLKAAGLGPQNFPLLYPVSATPQQPAVPVPQQIAVPARQQTAVPMPQAQEPTEKQATAPLAVKADTLQENSRLEPLPLSGPALQEEPTSMANQQYKQYVEMVDDTLIHQKPEKMRSHRPRRKDVLVINNMTRPVGSIIDRVRAASNVFGEDLVTLNLGDQDFTVSRAALQKHCGVLKDQDEEELEFEAASPLIVRAFINAISPCPSHGLPQHNFEFKRETYKQGLNSKDVLGVMNSDTVKVTKINWKVESLIEMHRLSVSFDCDIVQDMVVDEMRKLYLNYVKAGKVSDFVLPSLFLNELESGVDDPLLRLGVDIMRNQCKKLNRSLPNDLEDHVLEHTEWCGVAESHVLDSGPHAARCAQYHLHGENEPCYKVRTHKDIESARRDIEKTWEFTSNLYAYIKGVAADTHDHVMSAIEHRSTRPDQHKERQQKRRELVEWSQHHEEHMARILVQLEMLEQVKTEKLSKGKTLDTKFKETEQALRLNMSTLQDDHSAAWDCHQGVHSFSCEYFHKQKQAYCVKLLNGKFVVQPKAARRCWSEFWA